jgi:hypothetical protein
VNSVDLLERARRTQGDHAETRPTARQAAAERALAELLAAHESTSSFAEYIEALPARPASLRSRRYIRARSLDIARQQSSAMARALQVIAEFEQSGNASLVLRRAEAVLQGEHVSVATLWDALRSDEMLQSLSSSVGLSNSVAESIDQLIGTFEGDVGITQDGIEIRRTSGQEQMLRHDSDRLPGGLLVGLARGAAGMFHNNRPSGITWTRPGAPVMHEQGATRDVTGLIEALDEAVRKESIRDLKARQSGERAIAEGQWFGILLVVALVVTVVVGIIASFKCHDDPDSDWCTIGFVAWIVAAVLGAGFDEDLDNREPGKPETDVGTLPRS